MKNKAMIMLLACSFLFACGSNSNNQQQDNQDSLMTDTAAAMDTTQTGTMDQMDGTDATNTGADTSGGTSAPQ